MKRLLSLFAALCLFALPARATWSIVAVNPETGEVAVASATCIKLMRLEKLVPVLVVGHGAGAAQSAGDSSGVNRVRMWNGLHAGWTPEEILTDLIENGTQPDVRQYGIAAFTGDAVTFSGPGCGPALGNVIGEIDGIHYAIQGNVLTGEEVAQVAEEAFRSTNGDLTQRMMAAMEGARSMGGDGRCSCNGSDPQNCGAPPPSFEKTAHCGFVFVSRLGDTDGTCAAGGCANGDYYLQIAATGGWNHPDPVFVLQDKYDEWRSLLVARPDHLLSTVTAPAHSLVADGHSATMVTVRLVDVNGDPLIMGGAVLTVAQEENELLTVGEVADHDDGTYSFPVTAGLVAGTARLIVTADDSIRAVQLRPPLELRIDPLAELHCGRDLVACTEDTATPLTLNLPAAAAQPYLILCSASGTSPGLVLGDLTLPLNRDIFLWRSSHRPNNAFFRHTLGYLDPAGRAEATFLAPQGLLRDAIGRRLDWAALYFDHGLHVTNVVGFEVIHGSL